MRVVSWCRARPTSAVMVILLGGLVLVLFLGSGDRRTARPVVRRASPMQDFVTRRGDGLYLGGKPYRFTGVNAYQLATDYSLDTGCGPETKDPSVLFDTLPRGSVVRFWAFQAFAVAPGTHTRTWFALDRVVDEAQAHGIELAMTLSDQAGTCDDSHFHSRDWYAGGYKNTYNDSGKGTDLVSFDGWVREIVARYADRPSVAYWEPVNEPEASMCATGQINTGCYGHSTCAPGAAVVLRDFFTAVGAEIHQLDPRHLVASGQLGGGECGENGADYATVGSSPGLDILAVHDYGTDNHTGADARIAQARALGKPLVFEEGGEAASPSGQGCPTLAQRAATLGSKAAFDLSQPGVVGFLPWQWLVSRDPTCELAITPGDPLIAALGKLD